MKEHSVELRVRYEETDQMGVVYYANYLIWFEVARTEFFRAAGVEYRKMEEQDKIYIPVIEASCRYRLPLRYDDLVTVTAVVADLSPTRVTFDYEVKNDGKVTMTGRTRHAFINADGVPVAVPDAVREALSLE